MNSFSEFHDAERLRPIENFETSARDLSGQFANFTRSNLEDGWTRDGFSIPTVYPPVDWGAHNRSFSYHLHAWDAIADLLIGYCRLGIEAYFDASFAHARSWLLEFQAPLLGKDSPKELDALVRPHMPVEWYDMAVGLRAFRMAFMLDVMLRSGRYAAADIELFREGLLFHLKLLGRDHFIRVHSNHGLYQVLGQIAAARRFRHWPGMEAQLTLGLKRLDELLLVHFCSEGVHREHSPGYHYMLMGTLINARRSGLLTDKESSSFLAAIEDAFQWMVKPNNSLAEFGDTDPRSLLRGNVIAGLYSNPAAQYIISGGAVGTLPPAGVKAYHEAGYAFARLYAPDVEPSFQNASYLAQIAAFHSRVHKHADHLGFIWFDRGRDILIDPARFAYAGRTKAGSDLFNQGFWYADPKRIYVESTRAHNCVEIDGTSYPRRVKPFDSALNYAGEQNGMAVTDCTVMHTRTIRHRRVLVMAPGHFLLVLDWLNDHEKQHDYRQWFQFAPQWRLTSGEEKTIARSSAIEASEYIEETPDLSARGDGPELPDRQSTEVLSIFNLLEENAMAVPIRGQEEPHYQGWTSDAPYSLIPSTSMCIEALRQNTGRFATLLAFGRSARINRNATRFNATMRNGRIRWADEKGKHTLTFVLEEPGNVSVSLATDRPLSEDEPETAPLSG